MIPTHIALQLAAEHQREFESQAARRRLVRHLASTSYRPRRVDTVLPTVRRLATAVAAPHRLSVARAADGRAACCAA